ncbi:MAG: DNA repair protein RecO [Clostridia bacterium]|nr:DNA repair protein RecO [Clostridia bacterium]
MAHIKTKGFVIQAVPVGESDRIIRILTKEYGLISVSVRGARRTRSPHLLSTQVFSFSSFELFYNKNRYTLQSSELIEPFMALQQDLERLVCASHLSEVLLDSLRDDLAQPSLYHLWAYSMQSLSQDPDPYLVVHSAQMRLLMDIGFAPRLDSCVVCNQPLHPQDLKAIAFSVSGGGLVCGQPACNHRFADARPVSKGVILCLRHIQQAPLSRLFQFSLSDVVRHSLIELSAAYLSYHMEKSYTKLGLLRSLHLGNNQTTF